MTSSHCFLFFSFFFLLPHRIEIQFQLNGQPSMQLSAASSVQAVSSSLRYLTSVDEDWAAFIQRQSAALHHSIDAGDVESVRALFARGCVHISLRAQLTESLSTETGVMPLHRSAHANSTNATQILQFLLNGTL